ncbi:hypothetical protein HZS_1599 [Henneguya salminicola]|nr:hypothetical protein HZS_1599 [Henneguya salminicola]
MKNCIGLSYPSVRQEVDKYQKNFDEKEETILLLFFSKISHSIFLSTLKNIYKSKEDQMIEIILNFEDKILQKAKNCMRFFNFERCENNRVVLTLLNPTGLTRSLFCIPPYIFL